MGDKYIIGQLLTSAAVFVAVAINYFLIRREAGKIKLAAVEAAEKIEAKALYVSQQLEEKAAIVSQQLHNKG